MALSLSETTAPRAPRPTPMAARNAERSGVQGGYQRRLRCRSDVACCPEMSDFVREKSFAHLIMGLVEGAPRRLRRTADRHHTWLHRSNLRTISQRRLSKRRQTRLEADIRLLDKRLAEMVAANVALAQ